MTSILDNTRRPDVSFYRGGRIDITARVAKILKLRKGDVIDVAYDGWEYMLYVRSRGTVTVGRHEAKCFPTNRGKLRANNFRAHSAKLCRAILNASMAADAARLPAGQPVMSRKLGGMAVPLITRNPL